ncbi:hypothetical protein BKA62DRAFT_769948 [Auriculariales sp. MPI-PUGE-AT-0066]|nr:hypothetical protein BKA62DRAFT_769948 [Auriculariales sp. MPI-PUGE-AT-0066]
MYNAGQPISSIFSYSQTKTPSCWNAGSYQTPCNPWPSVVLYHGMTDRLETAIIHICLPTTTNMDIEYTRELTLHIPTLYVSIFLWLEPVLASLSGILCILQPTTMLQFIATTPLAPTPATTPQTHALLISLGGMYIQFAMIEALVLRAAPTWSVWRAVMLALAVCDLGHVAGLARIPGGVDALLLSGMRSGNWVTVECATVIPVYWILTVRAALALGVGVPRPIPARIKKQ